MNDPPVEPDARSWARLLIQKRSAYEWAPVDPGPTGGSFLGAKNLNLILGIRYLIQREAEMKSIVLIKLKDDGIFVI